MIVSCVRGGVQRGIGFLGDVRRMNVGLTRARNSLFILGNADALKSNSEWRTFVQDAADRNVMKVWSNKQDGGVSAFPGNLYGGSGLDSKRKDVIN